MGHHLPRFAPLGLGRRGPQSEIGDRFSRHQLPPHHLLSAMQPTAPLAPANVMRGEAIITLDGQPYRLKFNLRVLHAWTQLTGKAPSAFGAELDIDYIGAVASLLQCAVRQTVPGKQSFTQDEAIDLLDTLTPEQVEELGAAIVEAVTTDPLLAALRKQVAAKLTTSLPQENGNATSTTAPAS